MLTNRIKEHLATLISWVNELKNVSTQNIEQWLKQAVESFLQTEHQKQLLQPNVHSNNLTAAQKQTVSIQHAIPKVDRRLYHFEAPDSYNIAFKQLTTM